MNLKSYTTLRCRGIEKTASWGQIASLAARAIPAAFKGIKGLIGSKAVQTAGNVSMAADAGSALFKKNRSPQAGMMS